MCPSGHSLGSRGLGATGCPLDALARVWGQPPGARRTLAAAHSPLCPSLVPKLQLEPGLNLNALGSCPDTLPKGLGHSVPVPPAAARPGSEGSTHSGRRTTRSRGSTAHQTPSPARAGGHPTPRSGPWVGPRQPRPFGHCGLEAWLPPAPSGQPGRLPAPILALLATLGSPEASRARLPRLGKPGTEIAGGPHPGSSHLQSLPWGPGSRTQSGRPQGDLASLLARCQPSPL